MGRESARRRSFPILLHMSRLGTSLTAGGTVKIGLRFRHLSALRKVRPPGEETTLRSSDAKDESFKVQFHENPEVLHDVRGLPIGLDEIEAYRSVQSLCAYHEA